jgi:hypothetical protein
MCQYDVRDVIVHALTWLGLRGSSVLLNIDEAYLVGKFQANLCCTFCYPPQQPSALASVHWSIFSPMLDSPTVVGFDDFHDRAVEVSESGVFERISSRKLFPKAPSFLQVVSPANAGFYSDKTTLDIFNWMMPAIINL